MTTFGQWESTGVIGENRSSAIGIAAFVFGVISIFAFAPLLVPIALLLAIIGLITRQYAWSIVAIIAAGIGFITSPILMGLLLFFESGSSADLPVSLGTRHGAGKAEFAASKGGAARPWAESRDDRWRPDHGE